MGEFAGCYSHDRDRKALEAKFGDKVKIASVERVAEGADAERVLRRTRASSSAKMGLIWLTRWRAS